MPKVEFQRCVVVDGKAYATIAEAQAAILTNILDSARPDFTPEHVARKIIDCKEEMMAALTLTDSSRPGARKAFGGKPKQRKPKPAALPEPEAA